jgi:very-short-patch-repair endonuclease
VFDFEGVGAVSSFKKKEKAKNSTDPSELSKLAKSKDGYTRCLVAKNRHSPPDTLRALAIKETDLEERYWQVLDAIAGHPSTPMDALIYMIKNPTVLGHYQYFKKGTNKKVWTISRLRHPRSSPEELKVYVGWDAIAARSDLSEDVYNAFSHIATEQFITLYPDVEYTNKRLTLMLASRKGEIRVKGGEVVSIQQWMSRQPYFHIIPIVETEERSLFNEQLMLALLQTRDPEVEINCVDTMTNLPRSVALVLSDSRQWEILDGLQRRPDDEVIKLFWGGETSELTESEKSVIRGRLEREPEWVASIAERKREFQRRAAKRAEELKRQKIVDSSGKVVQQAALDSDVFDSPVEEVFWEAYRKSLPSALSGLVAQHEFGRYRLDFAIPKKKIGIELDGFRYHSSQEAIIKDRQRQRELEQQGWRIVRFAAKEVFDDPKGCVKQAARWAESL